MSKEALHKDYLQVAREVSQGAAAEYSRLPEYPPSCLNGGGGAFRKSPGCPQSSHKPLNQLPVKKTGCRLRIEVLY